MIDLSPQLRRTLLIGILLLVGLRLIVALPQEAPRAAEPAPQSEQHIVSDFCIGWCPK